MGSLYVIGIGNGNYDDLTLKAINILNEVEFIYCEIGRASCRERV